MSENSKEVPQPILLQWNSRIGKRFRCPSCKYGFGALRIWEVNYCYRCGQRIDWGKTKEIEFENEFPELEK